MSTPQTMFEKIWARHVVAEGPGGHVLLYVDRHLLHEGTTAAFGRLAKSGRRVRRPDLSFATADHYVLTSPGSPAPDAEVRGMVEALARHTGDQHIVHFGVGEARRGIVHVIGPEQGLTVPGVTLVCGDSHTATHGAGGGVSHAIEYAGSAIHAMSMDELAAGDIAPTVTWGASPQDALPITARVPDPAAVGDVGRRESMTRPPA